jgi:signal transduction histidine kinase
MSLSDDDRSDDGRVLSEGEALRRMYRITADHERPFEERLGELLTLGRTYLGVEAGFLTEISDGTQVIVEASGDHEKLQAGESCPLSKAYCRKTVKRENALTVQHAALEGWERDAAYEEFGLESYIGTKVVVDGDVYGTFCFADSEPREREFSEDEETYVELMAEWVSYELFQRQATARIERQRDQLEEFASVVSHDLRNPLSVAQGYLDLAEEAGDPEHIERCRDALDRMDALIEDLLVLAREGEEITDTESIDLAALVSECWSHVRSADATLEVENSLEIDGDPTRLQQLFENLFRNAIEHGGADVTVRVGTLSEGRGIYVEDDGAGIPEADRAHVFEDGYSTEEDGTGFGLSITKKVVDAHGWDVAVSAGSDGGARFEITGLDEGESDSSVCS